MLAHQTNARAAAAAGSTWEAAMRTRTRLLGALGAAVLAGGAWTAGTAGATSAEARPPAPRGVLELDVRTSPFFFLDFSAEGVRTVTSVQEVDPSKGDQTVFRDELLRDGRVVGHDGGTCTVTETPGPGATSIPLSCTLTFEVDGQQITAQGLASSDPVKRLAITGGTGRWAGAAGVVTFTENGDGTADLVFAFDRRRR